MKDLVTKEFEIFKLELEKINNLEEWKQIKSKFLNKSKLIKDLEEILKKTINIDEKKEIGIFLNQHIEKIDFLLNEKRKELESRQLIDEKKENIFLNYSQKNVVLKKEYKGKLHPLTILTNKIILFFLEKHFSFIAPIEVESEYYNFDILNMPKGHHARSKSDTFYLNNNNLLRTHCTNITARTLESKKINNAFTIGSVFRNDDNDATHSFQFSQIDFFAISEGFCVANLKYFLNEFLKFLFGNNITTIFRFSYFPFTEVSFEIDILCQKCNGKKCNACANKGSIEILGAGMLGQSLLTNAKINYKKFHGFASGIGLERLAMIKWQIADIREFYNNDLEFLMKNYEA